ncbi:MAG: aminotransferase class I/II-fold pyridoxal phosphate-dependent enzyme [Actinobacteria bacterium]|nr:aminotransferase class I/II-fold pyridoxal phosphate-dependent enzyme [Actinomycetota bacterium]
MEIGEEEKQQVLEVLDRKYLFRYYGPEKHPSKVRELELKFAEKVGAKYALAVTNCTSALITALVACGVGPGDEVIVNGYTFFASCASIVGAKAIPVIAEVDETLTIDPDDIEKKITPSTKALYDSAFEGIAL